MKLWIDACLSPTLEDIAGCRAVGEEEFLDRDEAEVAYSRLEAEHRSANGDRQVVLVGAPSREAFMPV